MADHIAVGIVHDDETVRIVLESAQKLVRDVIRIHFGMGGERGGIEAALDLDLILAFGRFRGLAVEEASDMTELLSLRDAQLFDSGTGDDFTEKVVHSAACPHRAKEVVLELIPVAREAEIYDL